VAPPQLVAEHVSGSARLRASNVLTIALQLSCLPSTAAQAMLREMRSELKYLQLDQQENISGMTMRVNQGKVSVAMRDVPSRFVSMDIQLEQLGQ